MANALQALNEVAQATNHQTEVEEFLAMKRELEALKNEKAQLLAAASAGAQITLSDKGGFTISGIKTANICWLAPEHAEFVLKPETQKFLRENISQAAATRSAYKQTPEYAQTKSKMAANFKKASK